ncbi:MAG: alpha/beta fold hydrolase [Longicatena sp.]
MKLETFTILSKKDGLRLVGSYCVPEIKVKGVVQLVHGMAEHKERYEGFMKALASFGYASVIHDLRGHGASVRDDQDIGYFYEESGTFMVEDTHEISLLIKEKMGDVPFILFGHSMGSLIVRAYCKKYDNDIDALIVCGSPSKNKAAPLACTLVNTMKKIKGERYRSAFIQNLAFGPYKKKFPKETSENCWLSCNANVVKEYDNDRACGYTFTLNGFLNLFHLMMNVYEPSSWVINKPNLPILFIAGSEDPCIGSRKAFQESIDLMKKIGYAKVDARLIEGKRHEILNEDNKDEVYEILKNWIEKATKK